jgi:hypothetical protein
VAHTIAAENVRTEGDMTTTNTSPKQIADATFDDASGARHYPMNEWRKAARLLATRGFTAVEIAWVLRSKWMRWAAVAGNAADGRATALMLERFLDDPRHGATRDHVQKELQRDALTLTEALWSTSEGYHAGIIEQAEIDRRIRETWSDIGRAGLADIVTAIVRR